MPALTNTMDPVINLQQSLTLARPILLDARSEPEFLQGHLGGAQRVPIEQWTSAAKDPATSLTNTSFWEQQIGALGIDGTRTAVIYDGGDRTDAARVWFILQYFGVDARVLQFEWLVADEWGVPIETGPQTPAPVLSLVTRQPRRVELLDKNQVRAELGTSTRIVDARSAAEFSGENLRNNPRGGHLPGAIHLPREQLVNAGGYLLPADELRAVLENAGFQAGDSLVTHCDGGGRAALAALAAVRAGYQRVHAYYLGFADWAKDDACPLVRD